MRFEEQVFRFVRGLCDLAVNATSSSKPKPYRTRPQREYDLSLLLHGALVEPILRKLKAAARNLVSPRLKTHPSSSNWDRDVVRFVSALPASGGRRGGPVVPALSASGGRCDGGLPGGGFPAAWGRPDCGCPACRCCLVRARLPTVIGCIGCLHRKGPASYPTP